jgi:hypothetical protein
MSLQELRLTTLMTNSLSTDKKYRTMPENHPTPENPRGNFGQIQEFSSSDVKPVT